MYNIGVVSVMITNHIASWANKLDSAPTIELAKKRAEEIHIEKYEEYQSEGKIVVIYDDCGNIY